MRATPVDPGDDGGRSAVARGALAPRSIDVLPLDLEVWAEDGAGVDVDNMRASTEAAIIGTLTTDLARRGVQLGALIDWNGQFVAPNGVVAVDMEQPQLMATVSSLARYGEHISVVPGPLPVPYLPVRLGATTGTDATLYVGGWGYAGKHHTSTGVKIAEGIGIAAIVVVLAVVIVASAKGGGGGLGHLGGAVAHGAGHLASASRGAVHGAGGVMHGGGNAIAHAGRVAARVDDNTNLVENVIDAMGHTHSAGDADDEHPDWEDDKALPHTGKSQMFLEMTLVDNHTGLVMWHAEQRVPANPRSAKDVQHAEQQLLASFPAMPAR